MNETADTLKQAVLRRTTLGDPALVLTEHRDGRRVLSDILNVKDTLLEPSQDVEVEADLWDFEQGFWEIVQQHERWLVRIRPSQVPLISMSSATRDLLVARDWPRARWPMDKSVSQVVSQTLGQEISLERVSEPEGARDTLVFREKPTP